MKGAGALKSDAEGMSEVSAVAGDHCGEHGGVVWSEAQGDGQAAHGRGQGKQAGTGGVLQGVDAAGWKGGGGWAQSFDPVDAYGGGGGDALVDEKILTAPDAGIMIGLGLKEADDGAKAVAAMKGLWGGRSGCVCRPANDEAYAACDRGLRVVGVGNDFQAGDAEVDSLRGLLLGVVGGGLGGIVVVEVLLDLAA